MNAASLCAEACRAEGACRLRTERAGDGPYRCYAGSDEECRSSEACANEGRCAVAEDGECARPDAVEGRRCAGSVMCRSWGGCHPRDGFCEPQTDADCLASLECTTQGRCHLAPRNLCVARPEDCGGTTGCALEGLCTWQPDPPILGGGGRCGLGASGDCSRSLACLRDGRCAPRPLEGCSEGCRVFYCGHPDGISAALPCTEGHGQGLLACEPDGRCMRSALGVCEHVP